MNDANNRKSFAETLYQELAKSLESEKVVLYGHDDYTKAGFNCNWVKYDVSSPKGISETLKDEKNKKLNIPNPEFHMPIELQLGNHETCNKKSGYIGVR